MRRFDAAAVAILSLLVATTAQAAEPLESYEHSAFKHWVEADTDSNTRTDVPIAGSRVEPTAEGARKVTGVSGTPRTARRRNSAGGCRSIRRRRNLGRTG